MAATSWTPELVTWAVAQWNDGWSAQRIATSLGMTRNQVIGKMTRLGLGRSAPAAPGCVTTQIKRPRPATPAVAAQVLVASKPIARAAQADAPTWTPPTAGSRACKWPIGDPREPDFSFCGSPAAPGRPYCGDHCRVAYVKAPIDRKAA